MPESTRGMADLLSDFVGGKWQTEVNVRDFIQKNYTPYDGDASFLTGPTEATKKLWEECLPHIEFAYNRSLHSTTKMCPFEIVYGFVPRAPIDLLPLPSSVQHNLDATQRAEMILNLHKTTKDNIEHMNAKYKLAGDKGRKHVVFDVGDLVWLHLHKDRFPDLRKSRLMPRAAGPVRENKL